MSGQKRRKRSNFFPWMQVEDLELRTLLSGSTIIPIVSGQHTSVVDADGTRVTLILKGPGSGSVNLTNATGNKGALDTLTLNDTTGATSLTIRTAGGKNSGTSIHNVVINGASGQDTALKEFIAKQVDLGAGGNFNSSAGIGSMQIRNALSNSQINVTGNLNALIKSMSETKIQGASLLNGDFGDVQNSTISATSIGNLNIKGDLIGSSILANMLAGSDAQFGTIDDSVANLIAQGTIGSIKIQGSTGNSADDASQIVASGQIGPVTFKGSKNPTASSPSVWQYAGSVFTPVSIAQQSPQGTGYSDSNIWIAVYGQVIPIPTAGEVPGTGTTYYLTASQVQGGNPIPQTTANLQPGTDTPDQVILPSSTLADWGGNLSIPVPAPGYQYTGRIIISVGAPVQAQINTTNGSISAPSASNVTDPSNGTFYDFLEFTATNFNGTPNLDVDTSQVDSFGIPMKLQFFQDTAGTVPYNYNFTGNLTAGSYVITGIPDTTNIGAGASVTGAGIPLGATIQSVVNSAGKTPGTATLNLPASTTTTGASLVAVAAGPVGVQATRSDVVDPTNSSSFISFLKGLIIGGNKAAEPFLESYANEPTAPVSASDGVITGASNGSPIQITSVGHGLVTGDVVSVKGVGGNTAANGTFQVTVVDPNNFTLDGSNGAVNASTGNAAYTSGGIWLKGTITGASNAGPIVITSSTTGLQDGDIVRVEGVLGNTAANGLFVISDVTSTSFTLVGTEGSGAYSMGGYYSVYAPPLRLVSPKDIVDVNLNPAATDPLNNYFNSMVDDFFLKYYTGTIKNQQGGGETFKLVSSASGKPITYSGTTQYIGGYYVLKLNAEKGTAAQKAVNYYLYYPFYETNLPDPSVYEPLFYLPYTPAPGWVTNAGGQYESVTQMVFNCDGIFADNTARGMTGDESKIMGDLENSISAALNRGVALKDPSEWGEQTKWFVPDEVNSGIYNYWVQYFHKTGLTFGNLAYSFPYDDKFGDSTNLSENNVGLMQITLGDWSGTQSATTTAFSNFPSSALQGGQISLTASVAGTGTPTGTITFYIDGLAINSMDASSSPPTEPIVIDGSGMATIIANLPALADGSITHTYTVTAVYSGDATHLPSITYQSLQLEGANGDFPVTVSPNTGPAGQSVNVTATVPGGSPSGQVQFYFTRGDGSDPVLLQTVQVTGNNVPATLTIPNPVLSIVGTTTTSSNSITEVENVVGLASNQVISGTNIPAGTIINGFTPTVLILSNPASLTEIATLTSGGVTFQANITQGSTTVTGVLNSTGLSQGAAITGIGIPGSTMIHHIDYGSIAITPPIHTSVTGSGVVTLTSDGVGGVFLIQAVYTPTGGPSQTGQIQYSVTS